MPYASGFVDDAMFSHNRPGRGDANRAYDQKVTHQGQYGLDRPVVRSDILDRFLNLCINLLLTTSTS